MNGPTTFHAMGALDEKLRQGTKEGGEANKEAAAWKAEVETEKTVLTKHQEKVTERKKTLSTELEK